MEKRGLRVFENRVLRRIFRPNRDEVTVEWRRLHNEELHDLNSPPNVIRMMKSRTIKWAVTVTQRQEICIQDFGGET